MKNKESAEFNIINWLLWNVAVNMTPVLLAGIALFISKEASTLFTVCVGLNYATFTLSITLLRDIILHRNSSNKYWNIMKKRVSYLVLICLAVISCLIAFWGSIDNGALLNNGGLIWDHDYPIFSFMLSISLIVHGLTTQLIKSKVGEDR